MLCFCDVLGKFSHFIPQEVPCIHQEIFEGTQKGERGQKDEWAASGVRRAGSSTEGGGGPWSDRPGSCDPSGVNPSLLRTKALSGHHNWDFTISKHLAAGSTTEILQSEPKSRTSEAVVKPARGSYKYKNKNELACKHDNESIKSYRIICNVPSNSMHAPPKLKNIHIYLTLFPRGTLAIWQVVNLMCKMKT
jgi:hypothetical protein